MCACSPIVTGSEQVVFGGVREVDRVDVFLVPADHQCLRVLARLGNHILITYASVTTDNYNDDDPLGIIH